MTYKMSHRKIIILKIYIAYQDKKIKFALFYNFTAMHFIYTSVSNLVSYKKFFFKNFVINLILSYLDCV